MKQLLLLLPLLSACDSMMSSSIENVPDAFETEEVIYVAEKFPSCYASTIKITQGSHDHFTRNSDDFRFSKAQGQHYKAWQKTPIPSEFLTDEYEGIDIAMYNAIEQGVTCFLDAPDKVDPYHSIYWEALRSEGSYYSRLEDSNHTFILFVPEHQLLFHSIW